MSVAFLLLGKTYVAFYDATIEQRISTETPAGGLLGAVEDVAGALGIGEAGPEALWTLDVSISETHSLESEITQHPVEVGIDITDNIRNKPRPLRIDGVVTDTPSGLDALLVVPGLINRFTGLPPSIETFQNIEQNWVNKKIFDVVTSLKVYTNMAIRRIDFPRNAEVGRSLQFSIDLIEVLFVTSQTADETGLGADSGLAGSNDLGSQTGSPI